MTRRTDEPSNPQNAAIEIRCLLCGASRTVADLSGDDLKRCANCGSIGWARAVDARTPRRESDTLQQPRFRTSDTAAARSAHNESFFRDLNERITRQRSTSAEELLGFACECDQLSCTARIRLTTSEYRAVRANPRHFAVEIDHVDTAIERVVASTDRYMVVEKHGVAGDTAAELAEH